MDAPLLASLDALCTDAAVNHATIQEAPAFTKVLDAVPTRVAFAELIRGMGTYLTHGDGDVRRKATAVLAAVLEHWAAAGLYDNVVLRPDSVSILLGFFCARLGDYPSVAPCIRGIRALLQVAEAKPDSHPTAATQASKALFTELHVPAMEQPLRHSVYSLLLHLLQSPVHGPVVAGKGGDPVAACADFGAGFAATMDGEKDPRCLMLGLQGARAILATGPPLAMGASLPPAVVEELFDVTACYFPITFTPPPNDPHGITREGLVGSLRAAFASNASLAPHVLPLLLEKLGSSVPDAKRDAAQTLVACARAYGVPALEGHLRQIATALKAEAVFPDRAAAGGAAPASTGAGGAASLGAGGVPANSLLWTAGIAGDAPGVWRPAQASPSPGSPLAGAADDDVPAAAFAADGEGLGASAGRIGLDFSGPAHFHGRSGYGLFDAAATSSASAAGAEALPVVEEVLAAVHALSAQLAAHVASTGSVAEWRDFGGIIVADALTEVERACDAPPGRASARLLCAVASSSSFGLGSIGDSVVPLVGPLYDEATANHRYGVRCGAVGLLAGLAHCVSPFVDRPPGQHPLSPHVERLAEILTEALTATPATPVHAGSAVTGGATAIDRGALLTSETRCIAAGGLADLCVRPPSPLLAPDHMVRVTVLLARVAVQDSDSGVRQAALRALCTIATARQRGADAVLQHALPLLLRGVTGDSATGAEGDVRMGGGSSDDASPLAAGSPSACIAALGQLASVSHLRVQRAVVGQLLPLAVERVVVAPPSAPGGAEAAAPRLALRSGVPSVAILTTLAEVVAAKATVGDSAAVDDLIVAPSVAPAGAGDAPAATEDATASFSAMLPLVPSFVYLLVDEGAPAGLLAPAEAALRMAAIGASAAVQDSLREAVTALVLCEAPGSPLPWARPAFHPFHSASAGQLAALPALLGALSCAGHKGASVPFARQLVPALLAGLFGCGVEGPAEQRAVLAPVSSCGGSTATPAEGSQDAAASAAAAAIARALGSIFNRLPSGTSLETLVAQAAAGVCRYSGVGKRTLAPLVAAARSAEVAASVPPSPSASGSAISIRVPGAARGSNSASDFGFGGAGGACFDFFEDEEGSNTATTTASSASGGSSGTGGGQQPSVELAPRLRERGVLALVWLAKGLAMRGHPASTRIVSALVNVVTGNAADLAGARSGHPAEARLAPLAGQGLGVVIADAPPYAPLSKAAGASTGGLYRQKLFSLVFGQYSALRGSGNIAGSGNGGGGAGGAGLLTPGPALSATSSMSTQEQLSISTPHGTPLVAPPPAPHSPVSTPIATSSGEASPTVLPARESASGALAAAPSATAGAASAAPAAAAGSSPLSSRDAGLVPLLLSLCAMAAHLPRAVLVGDVDRVLPLVIRALEVTAQPAMMMMAAASGKAGGKAASALLGAAAHLRGSAPADAVPPASELQTAVAVTALQSLRLLTTHAPTAVSVHVHSLVPVLLALSRYVPDRPSSTRVRATAVDCLRGFVALPYHRLHPVRQQVVSGLVPALDDPKRAVRRRAGACRNDWFTTKMGQ